MGRSSLLLAGLIALSAAGVDAQQATTIQAPTIQGSVVRVHDAMILGAPGEPLDSGPAVQTGVAWAIRGDTLWLEGDDGVGSLRLLLDSSSVVEVASPTTKRWWTIAGVLAGAAIGGWIGDATYEAPRLGECRSGQRPFGVTLPECLDQPGRTSRRVKGVVLGGTVGFVAGRSIGQHFGWTPLRGQHYQVAVSRSASNGRALKVGARVFF